MISRRIVTRRGPRICASRRRPSQSQERQRRGPVSTLLGHSAFAPGTALPCLHSRHCIGPIWTLARGLETAALGQRRQPSAYSGRCRTRISPVSTSSTFASANPASAPCRTSALDQRVWPLGLLRSTDRSRFQWATRYHAGPPSPRGQARPDDRVPCTYDQPHASRSGSSKRLYDD
jgi:hypothetical protein